VTSTFPRRWLWLFGGGALALALAVGFILGFFAAGRLVTRSIESMGRLARTTSPPMPLEQRVLPSIRLGDPPSPTLNLNFGLRLEDPDGKAISLSAFQGKVLFVNLWASYCGPCLTEMPALADLYKALGNDPRIAFLAVSKDDRQSLARFLARQKVPLPVYRLPEGSEIEGTGTAVPVTLIADENGKVVSRVFGAVNWNDPLLIADLKRLLTRKGGPQKL
jgi:thiol-disulfide isomerase/thioredoxin